MKKNHSFLQLLFLLLMIICTACVPVHTFGSDVVNGTVGTPVDYTEPETAVPDESETAAQTETAAPDEQSPSAEPSPAAGDVVLQWENYSAQLLRYKVNRFEHSDAALYLYMRIVNHTDRTMTLKLDEITVDGVAVTGAGIYEIKPGTDTGADSKEYCLLVPDPDHSEAGSEAIVQASEVKAVMVLKDSESQEELHRQDVNIHLTGLASERNVWEQTNGQAPAASEPVDVTVAPEQAKEAYHVLAPWSKGEDVKKLQEKLIELGYLDDTADGSLGPNTQEAVKAFNEANGLPGGQTADAATQELLFSSQAAAYTEPEFPLTVSSQFEYEPVTDDNSFFFRIQVTNESKTRTIRGYELEVYTTDVWNNKLSGEDPDTQTMTQKISPKETLMSGNFYLSDYDTVNTVWVKITKVVFTDGEIRENGRDVFYPCEISSRITQ